MPSTHAATSSQRFWAKVGTSRDAQQHHPVICHLIDTAAVARAISRDFLGAAAREVLKAGLGIRDDDALDIWLGFLAGTHDLGKVSPAFQFQVPEVGAALVGDRYYQAWRQTVRHPTRTPHGAVTALQLPTYLRTRGLDKRLADRLAKLVGGHHGFFPTFQELRALQDDEVGEGHWLVFRRSLLDDLAAHAGLDGVTERPTRCEAAAAMILSGLTTVADWIASSQELFPYAPDAAIDAYAQEIDARAASALRKLGWSRPEGRPRPFSELFPGIEPRPLQRTTIELAETLAPPALVLVEAAMGEGKTEAALHLADHWQHSAGLGGFFTALPSQATSNQMWERVRGFLSVRYAESFVNLTLSHGHALLKDDYLETVCRLDQVHDENAQVAASEWHTARKRTLLSPYGVGTLDQGLMGVMRARHQFVRLFGLAGRCVIVDEVHAYDLYTSTLIERFLTWMAVLGSPVIALSATLPRESRSRLLRAYADGLQIACTPAEQAPYPRLSVLSREQQTVIPFEASAHVRRTLALRWVEEPAWLNDLVEVVLAGGNAAVICSTVGRAQSLYQMLAERLPPENRDLFHGRFLVTDRQHIERRCLSRFGKSGDRPQGFVLVATQVIEQSLDVDFDLMVSDLAPADLLLQRTGRLQRHERPERPPSLRVPTLWLIAPGEKPDGSPDFGDAGWVYDDHVLLRTWVALRGLDRLAIPEAIDGLIDSVYDLDQPPPPLEATLRNRWMESLEKYRSALDQQETKAIGICVPLPEADKDPGDYTNTRAEDDETEIAAVTRLGRESLTAIVLRRVPEGLVLPRTGRLVDLDAPPDAASMRDLLQHSVRLSLAALVRALKRAPAPSGWSSALLRSCRPIILEADGRCEVGTTCVRLDDDLGVVLEKQPKEPPHDV